VESVTVTELRRSWSRVFRLVEQGETVQVTRHGRPIARVVPTNSADAGPSWKRPGLRLVSPGTALAAAVLEERQPSP
jgi:prevent-host-death family protein